MTGIITCTRVGVHPSALTRGGKYVILAHNEVKREVKIEDDNKRARWYPIDCFDLSGGDAPILVSWAYDEPFLDETNGGAERSGIVDVRFELSDGQRRWCTFVTPAYLTTLLEPRDQPSHWAGAFEPGVYGRQIIVVRSVGQETVDWMLHHMDQQNELIDHSILLEPQYERSRSVETKPRRIVKHNIWDTYGAGVK